MNKDFTDLLKATDAVVFDMDGTLVDTTMTDYLAWTEIFKIYKSEFVPFEEYHTLLGIKSSEILSSMLGLEGAELEKAMELRMSFIERSLLEQGVTVFPGVPELLGFLRSSGKKMALATGAREEKMRLVLSKCNLGEYFNTTVNGDEVSQGKPSPETFQKAAERLNVDPLKTIVFEDAVNGLQAAKAAGMICIAITHTTPAEKLKKADLVISSYKDLIDFRS